MIEDQFGWKEDLGWKTPERIKVKKVRTAQLAQCNFISITDGSLTGITHGILTFLCVLPLSIYSKKIQGLFLPHSGPNPTLSPSLFPFILNVHVWRTHTVFKFKKLKEFESWFLMINLKITEGSHVCFFENTPFLFAFGSQVVL